MAQASAQKEKGIRSLQKEISKQGIRLRGSQLALLKVAEASLQKDDLDTALELYERLNKQHNIAPKVQNMVKGTINAIQRYSQSRRRKRNKSKQVPYQPPEDDSVLILDDDEPEIPDSETDDDIDYIEWDGDTDADDEEVTLEIPDDEPEYTNVEQRGGAKKRQRSFQREAALSAEEYDRVAIIDDKQRNYQGLVSQISTNIQQMLDRKFGPGKVFESDERPPDQPSESTEQDMDSSPASSSPPSDVQMDGGFFSNIQIINSEQAKQSIPVPKSDIDTPIQIENRQIQTETLPPSTSIQETQDSVSIPQTQSNKDPRTDAILEQLNRLQNEVNTLKDQPDSTRETPEQAPSEEKDASKDQARDTILQPTTEESKGFQELITKIKNLENNQLSTQEKQLLEQLQSSSLIAPTAPSSESAPAETSGPKTTPSTTPPPTTVEQPYALEQLLAKIESQQANQLSDYERTLLQKLRNVSFDQPSGSVPAQPSLERPSTETPQQTIEQAEQNLSELQKELETEIGQDQSSAAAPSSQATPPQPQAQTIFEKPSEKLSDKPSEIPGTQPSQMPELPHVSDTVQQEFTQSGFPSTPAPGPSISKEMEQQMLNQLSVSASISPDELIQSIDKLVELREHYKNSQEADEVFLDIVANKASMPTEKIQSIVNEVVDRKLKGEPVEDAHEPLQEIADNAGLSKEQIERMLLSLLDSKVKREKYASQQQDILNQLAQSSPQSQTQLLDHIEQLVNSRLSLKESAKQQDANIEALASTSEIPIDQFLEKIDALISAKMDERAIETTKPDPTGTSQSDNQLSSILDYLIQSKMQAPAQPQVISVAAPQQAPIYQQPSADQMPKESTEQGVEPAQTPPQGQPAPVIPTMSPVYAMGMPVSPVPPAQQPIPPIPSEQQSGDISEGDSQKQSENQQPSQSQPMQSQPSQLQQPPQAGYYPQQVPYPQAPLPAQQTPGQPVNYEPSGVQAPPPTQYPQPAPETSQPTQTDASDTAGESSSPKEPKASPEIGESASKEQLAQLVNELIQQRLSDSDRPTPSDTSSSQAQQQAPTHESIIQKEYYIQPSAGKPASAPASGPTRPEKQPEKSATEEEKEKPSEESSAQPDTEDSKAETSYTPPARESKADAKADPQERFTPSEIIETRSTVIQTPSIPQSIPAPKSDMSQESQQPAPQYPSQASAPPSPMFVPYQVDRPYENEPDSIEFFKAEEEVITKEETEPSKKKKSSMFKSGLRDSFSPDLFTEEEDSNEWKFVRLEDVYEDSLLYNFADEYDSLPTEEQLSLNHPDILPDFTPQAYVPYEEFTQADGFFQDIEGNPVQAPKEIVDEPPEEEVKESTISFDDTEDEKADKKSKKNRAPEDEPEEPVRRKPKRKPRRPFKLSYNFRYLFTNKTYQKYKTILNEAAQLVSEQRLDEALDYYYVIRDQNIPEAFRMMIDENIKEITRTMIETFRYSDTIVQVKETGQVRKLRAESRKEAEVYDE